MKETVDRTKETRGKESIDTIAALEILEDERYPKRHEKENKEK